MSTRERDEEVEASIADLAQKVGELSGRVEDLEACATLAATPHDTSVESACPSCRALSRVQQRAARYTNQGGRRSVGGVAVPASVEPDHAVEGAAGALAPTGGGGPPAPGAPGNRGPSDDEHAPRVTRHWIGGTYHLIVVEDPESGPWSTLCREHVVETLETKTPGAFMDCPSCNRRVREFAELALEHGLRYGRAEARARAELEQAAGVALHRLRDCGWQSNLCQLAFERWRETWVRWAEIFDRSQAGGT